MPSMQPPTQALLDSLEPLSADQSMMQHIPTPEESSLLDFMTAASSSSSISSSQGMTQELSSSSSSSPWILPNLELDSCTSQTLDSIMDGTKQHPSSPMSDLEATIIYVDQNTTSPAQGHHASPILHSVQPVMTDPFEPSATSATSSQQITYSPPQIAASVQPSVTKQKGSTSSLSAVKAAAAAAASNGDHSTRPALSYARLAALAIDDSAEKKCTVGEIYAWIEEKFPYYRHGSPWWKNCIRHNLSMKKCFERIQSGTAGNFWAIDPAYREEILSTKEESKARKRRRNSAPAVSGSPKTSKKRPSVSKGSTKTKSVKRSASHQALTSDREDLSFASFSPMSRVLEEVWLPSMEEQQQLNTLTGSTDLGQNSNSLWSCDPDLTSPLDLSSLHWDTLIF